MATATTNRFKTWILILAPVFSMLLPYFVMWIDKNSRCNLISLLDVTDSIILFLAIPYFGVPLIALLYFFYTTSFTSANKIHDTDNAIQTETKLKVPYLLIVLNLLSPFLLIIWIIVFRFGSTCYQLELHIGF